MAVVHFFGGVDLGPQPLDNAGSASELVAPCSPVQQDSSDDSATVQSIINDIFSLSQGLVSKGCYVLCRVLPIGLIWF